MGFEETADQVRDRHLTKLGPKVGPVFHALWKDVVWLQVKWQEYRHLFGTPGRVDLANSAAGLFFRIVQDSLWQETLLHLSRLTDPPRSSGKTNLTLKVLPELIDDPVLRSDVSGLVNQAGNATMFARDWRNRHISHRDLDLAMDRCAEPLLPASRKQVSDAVLAIRAVLKHLSEKLLEETMASEAITPSTGAAALMLVLQDGVEARPARRERFRTGQHLPGDLNSRPIE